MTKTKCSSSSFSRPQGGTGKPTFPIRINVACSFSATFGYSSGEGFMMNCPPSSTSFSSPSSIFSCAFICTPLMEKPCVFFGIEVTSLLRLSASSRLSLRVPNIRSRQSPWYEDAAVSGRVLRHIKQFNTHGSREISAVVYQQRKVVFRVYTLFSSLYPLEPAFTYQPAEKGRKPLRYKRFFSQGQA